MRGCSREQREQPREQQEQHKNNRHPSILAVGIRIGRFGARSGGMGQNSPFPAQIWTSQAFLARGARLGWRRRFEMSAVLGVSRTPVPGVARRETSACPISRPVLACSPAIRPPGGTSEKSSSSIRAKAPRSVGSVEGEETGRTLIFADKSPKLASISDNSFSWSVPLTPRKGGVKSYQGEKGAGDRFAPLFPPLRRSIMESLSSGHPQPLATHGSERDQNSGNTLACK